MSRGRGEGGQTGGGGDDLVERRCRGQKASSKDVAEQRSHVDVLTHNVV